MLDDIKRKIKDTVGYMAENMRDDLMNREFRKVGLRKEGRKEGREGETEVVRGRYDDDGLEN